MSRRVKRFDWIAWMINRKQFQIGVEVGAGLGDTTEFILKNCPSIQNLTVVDLWEPVKGSYTFDRADMETIFRNKFVGEKRLTVLKGVSWEMSSKIKDRVLDFVFIDASHDYASVTKDIAAWCPKVKQGGLLCGHDLHFPGVAKATQEVFGDRLRNAGVDNVWFVKI